MDYEDVYYIDSRNAPAVVDHRTRVPAGRPTIVSTPRFPSAAPAPSTVPYQYPAAQPAYYGPAVLPQGYNSFAGYPVNPPYVLPSQVTPTSNLASILGGVGDIGVLSNLVAQAVAAFLPLPNAPTPADSSGVEDQSANAAVNSSNLIRYQSALAQFARRDQQILALGSVLKELFRRPTMG